MNLFRKYIAIKFIPIHLVFWVSVWLFFTYFFGFNSENKDYIFWFSSILLPITIVNTYFSIYYLIPRYLLTRKYALFILYSAYTLIGTAYLLSITMFFGYIFMSEFDFKQIPPLSRSMPFILMSMYMVVIVVSAFQLLMHNYFSMEKNKALENKFLQTQLQLKEQQLKFLKMQIHPHFLFNTLNTLYGFALKKADETPEMILKLSNLLDYILYHVDKPKVLLIDEVNHINDYISLEKMRFHDSLDVDMTISEFDKSIVIAPMLLLPFVENSFKHGGLVNGILNVDIRVFVVGEELEFRVENSIIDSEDIDNGIGLNNLKKRLEMLYYDAHELMIVKSEYKFEVVLKLKIND